MLERYFSVNSFLATSLVTLPPWCCAGIFVGQEKKYVDSPYPGTNLSQGPDKGLDYSAVTQGRS